MLTCYDKNQTRLRIGNRIMHMNRKDTGIITKLMEDNLIAFDSETGNRIVNASHCLKLSHSLFFIHRIMRKNMLKIFV